MTPSITKTRLALEKGDNDRVLRKRVIPQSPQTTVEDQNNNEVREKTETSPSPAASSAPYQIDDISYLINEREKVQVPSTKDSAASSAVDTDDDHSNWKAEIRWPDTIVQIFLHSGFLYGIYLLFFARFYSILWFFALIMFSGFGITAGAHRLWSHNTYTAKWPLRVILIFLFTISGQRDAYTWAHDHRVHHKFSETDADPHNCNRGFFFAHIGWVVLTPHPAVVAKRKVIDMRDLEADPIVMFQKKYFVILFAICSIAIPVLVPWYFWNESLWLSFWVMFNCRFCVTLNIAFCINSWAHRFGHKPYDKHIRSVDNVSLAIAAFGEGWHNYHHVFPWDYKTGEMSTYRYNLSTAFIDFFAYIGWAVNRKSVSPEMIRRRAEKCGDGTHFLSDAFSHKDAVWGYGDKDIPKEDQRELGKMNN